MARPFVIAAFIVCVLAGCKNQPTTPSPTPPASASVTAGGSSSPSPSVGPVTQSQPNRTGAISAAASPNPVPFSGTPIVDAPVCAGVANTWFYTVTLSETGGVDITINTVVDRIDGVVVNDLRQSATLRAFAGLRYEYRWCFTESRPRNIQSVFSGVDAHGQPVSIAVPAVVLQPRGAGAAVDPVVVTISPNPVPFSGAPITDAPLCAGVRNTWFWTLTLTETAGVDISLASVTDRINGVVVASDQIQPTVLRARTSITYNARWCSTSPASRTVQATFSGTDPSGRAVTIAGPVVTLLAAPGGLSRAISSGRGGGGLIRR